MHDWQTVAAGVLIHGRERPEQPHCTGPCQRDVSLVAESTHVFSKRCEVH